MDLVNGLRLMQNALSTAEGEGKLDYALPEATQTALDLVYKEIDDGWNFRVIASLMFKGFVKLQDNREKPKLSRSCSMREWKNGVAAPDGGLPLLTDIGKGDAHPQKFIQQQIALFVNSGSKNCPRRRTTGASETRP